MKKLLLTFCVLYSIGSILWYFTEGITRLIFLMVACALVPVVLLYLKSLALAEIKRSGKERKKELSNQKKAEKDEETREFLRNYDTEVKPLYLQGRDLFKNLMQKGKIHNYEMHDLRKILNDRLGQYADHYHNYKFKNDAHEVYVKMKNFNLNTYDWEIIINFLKGMEDNEPVKNQKKLEALKS